MTNKKQPEPRYELKYLIKDHKPCELQTLIKLHPFHFSEIYHERAINNVYCDDFRLSNYYQNLNGIGHRSKVRWRWYSQLLLQQQLQISKQLRAQNLPHLEIKVKEADLVKKYLFAWNQIRMGNSWRMLPAKVKALFQERSSEQSKQQLLLGTDKKPSSQDSALLTQTSLLQPVLLNSYYRRYFLSADGKIRLTIDTNIIFFRVKNSGVNWQQYWQLPATVLEMKADIKRHKHLSQAAKHFPFTLSRCSKYVLGISSCYPDLEAPYYQIPVHPQLTYDY